MNTLWIDSPLGSDFLESPLNSPCISDVSLDIAPLLDDSGSPTSPFLSPPPDSFISSDQILSIDHLQSPDFLIPPSIRTSLSSEVPVSYESPENGSFDNEPIFFSLQNEDQGTTSVNLDTPDFPEELCDLLEDDFILSNDFNTTVESCINFARNYVEEGCVVCTCGCGRRFLELESVKWYQAHLLNPVYPSATISSLDWILDMAQQLKVKGKVQRSVIDGLLRSQHDKLLPRPNFVPTSLHMMEKILDIEKSDKYMFHVCDSSNCSGHVWPHLSTDEYERNKHDICPECASPRFTITEDSSGKESIAPTKYMFYFGLHETVRSLIDEPGFEDDIFRSSRLDDQRAPGCFHLGSEASRISRVLGDHELWKRLTTLRFDFMLDWYSAYQTNVYSMGLVAIRCPDVSPDNIGKAAYCKPLVIIPGPRQPSNLGPYLSLPLELLATPLAADSKAKVTLRDGTSAELTLVLTGLLADSPARQKWTMWLGVNAHLHCGWCIHEGQTCSNEHADGKITQTVYYKGYLTKTLHTRGSAFLTEHRPASKQVSGKELGVGDARLLLSDAEQWRRALRSYEEPKIPASQLGCTGLSFVMDKIPYASYNNLFIVPIAHAFLYGVVKGFVNHLLRPIIRTPANFCADRTDVITQAHRRLMTERAQEVHVPSDFGRTYRDIVRYRDSYTMEEWMHFLEIFSAFVLKDVLSEDMLEMWLLLCYAGSHYLRLNTFRTQAHFLRESKLAGQRMMQYAQLLEYHGFPDNLFTYNLHMLVCRLPHQEKARGAACQELEFAVERCIQDAKSVAGRKHLRLPDKVVVNAYLWRHKVQHYMRLLEVEMPLVHHRAQDDALEDGCKLLGKAAYLSSEATYDRILNGATSFVNDKRDLGWTSELIAAAIMEGDCVEYASAKCHDDIITAAGKGKAVTRENCWALVRYDTGAYVILVRHLVKILPPDCMRLPVLRLAICEMFDKQPLVDERLFVAPAGPARWPEYGVRIEDINSKMVAFYDRNSEGEKYFMECEHLTKRRKIE